MEAAAPVRHAAATTGPGRGVLRFERVGARTVVSSAYASSPLRLLTPRNHGAAAWVYCASYGGGLVDGDALSLRIDVGPHAMAVLSTQASTKVYRSPAGTSMDLEASLREGATLVVCPDPVVCFAGATYWQTQRFVLDRTADLVFVDWLTSGRRAAGERWAFDAYRARTTIRREGRLVVHDALSLCAADGDLAPRIGRFDVLAVVALVGPRLGDHARRALTAVAEMPIVRGTDLLVSASAIGGDGAILRIAGMSAEQVGGAVRGFLSFVPSMLGDDLWAHHP